LFPETELASNISAVFDEQFTEAKVETEVNYFKRKFGNNFERPYGWAWLLKLQAELEKNAQATGSSWAATLRPLSSHVASLLDGFLPRLVYPVRVGEHSNSAFGLAMALDYTRTSAVADSYGAYLGYLGAAIVTNSTNFYGNDKNCPLSYEPSGSDFLSPCVQEADLMARVLEDDAAFREWINNFLPQMLQPGFSLEPGRVEDRTDGKLVHLDGLNFSRAWGLYRLARRIGGSEGERLREVGDIHVRASIDQVVGSDYVGSHWLASFLLHALEQRAET